MMCQGLQIMKKESVSPWDILEGHKNAGPLNLSWFGAVRLERKPLKYEEQHRLVAAAVCTVLVRACHFFPFFMHPRPLGDVGWFVFISHLSMCLCIYRCA